jgi:predicted O-methyltransferase YrrM
MKIQEIVDKALSIRGYTNCNKLFTLCKICQNLETLNGDIIEIGSAFGRSTMALILSSNKKIWSIDPHTGEDYGDRQISCEKSSFYEFIDNLTNNEVLHRVNVIRSTTEMAVLNEELIFSMAFIDGLHTAKAVKIDLDFVYPRICSNGIIVLDDYFEPSVQPYARAIDRFVKKMNVDLVKENELVWFKKV